jgi:hypothetical protein
MPWMINVSDMEDLLSEIEKKLYACGKDSSVTIVRHAFAWPRKAVWLDDSDRRPSLDVNLTNFDRVENEKG